MTGMEWTLLALALALLGTLTLAALLLVDRWQERRARQRWLAQRRHPSGRTAVQRERAL